MKLLILGGTRFLGRHLAEQALAAGHDLTLLHRGRSSAGLFPQAQHLLADRNTGLAALAGAGPWDAVIDTCGYLPRQVQSAAVALRGRVGRYLFVSSISAYAHFAAEGTDEDAPLATLADPATEALTGETYGGLKALCERALFDALPGQALVARPGLLVGPHDPTGRFSYWVQRIADGGEVLAPGDPASPVQFIDARDAAAWLLQQALAGTTGAFNLTGPTGSLSMGEFLETARQTLNPAASRRWADEAFLLAAGVAPWSDLPVWLSRADAGLHAVKLARAIATGLVCRPVAETLLDTHAWLRSLPPAAAGAAPAPGLSREREAELLAALAAPPADA